MTIHYLPGAAPEIPTKLPEIDLQDPAVQLILQTHLDVLKYSGILGQYNKVLKETYRRGGALILDSDDFFTGWKTPKRNLIPIVGNNNFTDSGPDENEQMDEFILVKIDLDTGEIDRRSYITVGEITGDDITHLNPLFGEDQLRCLECLISDQEAAGIRISLTE